MVVADERVDRSIVDEPSTTRLWALPVIVRTALESDVVDAGTSVDVATLEVTVEPSEFVVVTATVVGS